GGTAYPVGVDLVAGRHHGLFSLVPGWLHPTHSNQPDPIGIVEHLRAAECYRRVAPLATTAPGRVPQRDGRHRRPAEHCYLSPGNPRPAIITNVHTNKPG